MENKWIQMDLESKTMNAVDDMIAEGGYVASKLTSDGYHNALKRFRGKFQEVDEVQKGGRGYSYPPELWSMGTPVSGVEIVTASGHTFVMDDSVEEPKGKPEWANFDWTLQLVQDDGTIQTFTSA